MNTQAVEYNRIDRMCFVSVFVSLAVFFVAYRHYAPVRAACYIISYYQEGKQPPGVHGLHYGLTELEPVLPIRLKEKKNIGNIWRLNNNNNGLLIYCIPPLYFFDCLY